MAPRRSTMAFDAPRKTLDDIRRELDADYSSCVTPPPTPGDVTVLTTVPYVIEATPDDMCEAEVARRTRRLGYIVAALIGCLVGQGVLLGFFLIVRPTVADDSSVPSTSAMPTTIFEAPRAPDVTAASPPVAPFVPPIALPAPLAADRPAVHRVVSRSDAIRSTKAPEAVKP